MQPPVTSDEVASTQWVGDVGLKICRIHKFYQYSDLCQQIYTVHQIKPFQGLSAGGSRDVGCQHICEHACIFLSRRQEVLDSMYSLERARLFRTHHCLQVGLGSGFFPFSFSWLLLPLPPLRCFVWLLHVLRVVIFVIVCSYKALTSSTE